MTAEEQIEAAGIQFLFLGVHHPVLVSRFPFFDVLISRDLPENYP